MSLKFNVPSLDEVPEALRGFYSPSGDGFALAVDGAVPKGKLDEFRQRNVDLLKAQDELTARFAGIDPDEARKLAEKAQREKDKKLIDAGKVDELLAERVNAMKAEHDRQLAALTGERDGLTKQLGGLVIDGALRDAALKAGVRAAAVDDVLLRGRTVFQLDGGKAVAIEGGKPVYGKGGEPLDVAEWVGGLAERAPHLFEPSRGGGAPAGGGAGGAGGKPVVTRAQFDAMDPAAKIAAVKTSTIVD